MKLLSSENNIYAIADARTCLLHNISLKNFAEAFFNAGGKILQYRDKISSPEDLQKNAEELKTLSGLFHAVLIINDYIEIARNLKLPLHVGWDTLEISFQGRYGRSTHNPAEITKAIQYPHKPDYLAFGAVFPSKTKQEISVNTEYLNFLYEEWPNDIVLIGGIQETNIRSLPKDERTYYAIISDFFTNGSQPAQIEKKTRSLIATANL